MDELVSRFIEACLGETRCVELLTETLERERQVLISGTEAELLELAETKTTLLTELQTLGKARAMAMLSLQLTDHASLYAWLADKPEALAVWEGLSQALLRSQAVNRVNAELLQTRIDFVDESLSVLKAAASATLGYERDGTQPAGLTGGRHLGSA